jgi:hypothetical protein
MLVSQYVGARASGELHGRLATLAASAALQAAARSALKLMRPDAMPLLIIGSHSVAIARRSPSKLANRAVARSASEQQLAAFSANAPIVRSQNWRIAGDPSPPPSALVPPSAEVLLAGPASGPPELELEHSHAPKLPLARHF